ncbi:hypothetical protein M3J09_012180 [Ascochyta lentis]
MVFTNTASSYLQPWTALTLLGLDNIDNEQACSAHCVTRVMGPLPQHSYGTHQKAGKARVRLISLTSTPIRQCALHLQSHKPDHDDSHSSSLVGNGSVLTASRLTPVDGLQ